MKAAIFESWPVLAQYGKLCVVEHNMTILSDIKTFRDNQRLATSLREDLVESRGNKVGLGQSAEEARRLRRL